MLNNDTAERQQCDFRFRFKYCPQCHAENDITARSCHQCHALLVDADDKLKAALNLKEALVLRCGEMTLNIGSDEKGEGLKVCYFDEDGADVSEVFRLNRPAQRNAFEHQFMRLHQRAPGVPLTWQTANDVAALLPLLLYPDFVIARKHHHGWRIREKIFDYQGRFRRANQLS